MAAPKEAMSVAQDELLSTALNALKFANAVYNQQTKPGESKENAGGVTTSAAREAADRANASLRIALEVISYLRSVKHGSGASTA